STAKIDCDDDAIRVGQLRIRPPDVIPTWIERVADRPERRGGIGCDGVALIRKRERLVLETGERVVKPGIFAGGL
ncbi:hypothetical protein DF186_19850, partial [Enterococcus hirae]